MNRTAIILTAAGLTLAVIIGVIIGSQNHPAATTAGGPIGSKNSSVTASPTPTPVNPTKTAPTTTPSPSPSLPGVCYQDDAPASCGPVTVDPSTVITPEQTAADSVVTSFAAQFSQYNSAETPAARAARLQPLVATASVASQPTALSRPNTHLTGLTGTADPVVDYATYISTDAAGHWIYEADGSYTGRYTQQGTGSTTTFYGAVTWTITITADPSHKIVSVTEDAPTLVGAP